jgi:[ribosomal protein S18]-alanine N-acetyltransferase
MPASMTIINPTPSIAIRPLEPRDEERCARLMSTSEPWMTLGRDFEASLAVVRDPDAAVYVAEDDGRFAGFIVLSLTGVLNGYIRSIAVDPSRRGRGVGTQLMAFAEARIFAGSPNAFLCVTSFNDRARTLYERLGYQYVGELPDFFVRGVSELLYRKTRGSWADFKRETTINPVGTTQ